MNIETEHPNTSECRELADQRYGMALWYAYGIFDTRPDIAEQANLSVRTIRARLNEPPYQLPYSLARLVPNAIAEHSFALFHKDQAYAYHAGNRIPNWRHENPDRATVSLPSVQDAFKNWYEELTGGTNG